MWEEESDESFFPESLSESLELTESSTSRSTSCSLHEDLRHVSYFQHSYLEEEEEEEEEEETEVDEEDENCHSAVDARTRAPLLAPQSAEDKGRLTVVLDMDETLIHSDFIDPANKELYQHRKETSFAFLEGVEVDRGVAINVRPFLKEFMEEMGKHFEPIVFTAANEDYASAVLDTIDPCNHIRTRLYRESTVECRGMNFVKDLSILGRDMRRVVLVDNNLLSFLASPDNGIPCLDYYESDTDSELKAIMASLMRIKDMEDVRPFLRSCYGLKTRLTQHNPIFTFPDDAPAPVDCQELSDDSDDEDLDGDSMHDAAMQFCGMEASVLSFGTPASATTVLFEMT